MKIAVTYENGQVFQHFGHCAQFKIYDVENGAVQSSAVVDTNGSGHGALAGFLQSHGVNTLICGGIGGGARTALALNFIRALQAMRTKASKPCSAARWLLTRTRCATITTMGRTSAANTSTAAVATKKNGCLFSIDSRFCIKTAYYLIISCTFYRFTDKFSQNP